MKAIVKTSVEVSTSKGKQGFSIFSPSEIDRICQGMLEAIKYEQGYNDRIKSGYFDTRLIKNEFRIKFVFTDSDGQGEVYSFIPCENIHEKLHILYEEVYSIYDRLYGNN